MNIVADLRENNGSAASRSTSQLGEQVITVSNPYTGKVIGTVPRAGRKEVDVALELAVRGTAIARKMPSAQRAAILTGAAADIASRADAFSRCIVEESGKTIRQARKEVLRCVNTLTLCAEEAKRLAGETIPFASFAGSENRQGYYQRDPLGLIVGITPYNDPLNLAAHKVGPALASGNAIVLKPAELAPFSSIMLAEALARAGLPEGIFQVLTGDAETGSALVSARNVRMVSFTGGTRTAQIIAREAGLKRLAMDLGGNAPVIVMPDCNLEMAVESCVSGAFWAAGQNCIGTQRIIVLDEVYDRFLEKFVAQTRALVCGDPMDERTDVGPMITESAAQRTLEWIRDATREGAVVETGGMVDRTLFQPTVLTSVSRTSCVRTEEAFAPVVLIDRISSFDDAIAEANQPESMLHAGIFTSNLEVALSAIDRLEAAGVMINDSSDYRFDAMPFGGYKFGSLGREGVRFAIQEMTQPKVICFNRAPK